MHSLADLSEPQIIAIVSAVIIYLQVSDELYSTFNYL